MSGVTSRPITMQPESVRAIIDGRKTQTRRLVKLRCGGRALSAAYHADIDAWQHSPDGSWSGGCRTDGGWGAMVSGIKCSYGAPGDELWVKEAWSSIGSPGGDYAYRADGALNSARAWQPLLFMPRAASRLTLQVSDIRVERLQDITEEDASAEGYERDMTIGERLLGHPAQPEFRPKSWRSARQKFSSAWDEQSGYRSLWSANPWVWVVTFERATVPGES